MSSFDESVTTLALLRSLLDEVGRRNPSRDSHSPPTLRLQILRRLRKEAANGNAGAFELLAGLKSAMPASKGIPRFPAGEMRFSAGSWNVWGSVISAPFDLDLGGIGQQIDSCHDEGEIFRLLFNLQASSSKREKS